MMLNWQAVFFDFDGVIADSVQVKTAAFETMFSPYGKKVVKQVITYHLENGGMPRYQKLIYCYKEFLDQQLSDEKLQLLGDKFSTLVLEGVVKAKLIPGAIESLQELQRKNIPAFVVSGTPHEEMQIIVQRRGLTPYFKEVHGSPRTKTEIVTDLLQRHNCDAEQCLFIGDALADYKAAVDTGTHFRGITNSTSSVAFPEGTPLSSRVNLNSR